MLSSVPITRNTAPEVSQSPALGLPQTPSLSNATLSIGVILDSPHDLGMQAVSDRQGQ